MLVLESLAPLLGLVVVVAIVGLLLAWRRPSRARPTRGWRRRSPWLGRIQVVLVAGAVIFLGLAFTQFRFLREASSAGTVVLVLDVSESMSRTDIEPSRLEAAKEAARVFLDRLPTDIRVGLVTFAARVDVLVEPTQPRVDVVTALDDLPRGEGTLLGDGLDAALETIEADLGEGEDAPAAVVLLSDGKDCSLEPAQCPPGEPATRIDPADAARRARDLGVQVHTVMLVPGSGAGVEESVALLREIATTTDGSASTTGTASGLIELYKDLESQISTELAISDRGALFVVIAALFAIAAAVAVVLGMRSEY